MDLKSGKIKPSVLTGIDLFRTAILKQKETIK